jgi:hypothetical protein
MQQAAEGEPMPSGKPRENRPPSHVVYIDDQTWNRIVGVASRSKRSASDLIREMVDVELPRFEAQQKNGARHD